MRDSALKPARLDAELDLEHRVGNELMRDSALKRAVGVGDGGFQLLLEMSSCATAL